MTLYERLAGANTVEEYQKIIQECLERIDLLQEVCEHPEVKPEMYMAKPGLFYPTLMCKECSKAISGITEEQRREVWRLSNYQFYSNCGD